MKRSAKVEHSRACCEFLKVCQNGEVIPNTCKVKINAKPAPNNVIDLLRKQNLKEASKKELELAIQIEELSEVKARVDLAEAVEKMGEELPEAKKEALMERVNEKKESQFLHFRSQYKKKFQFLRQKQQGGGQATGEQMEDILPVVQSATSSTSHAGLEQRPAAQPASG